MTDVKITGLSKNFGATEVLKAINLEVRSGEFIVFVGPSGCGKSTLLRCIAGLEKISVGSLEIGGRAMNDVPAAQRGIAMVFQTYALYPHMSVAQNMSYALRLAGMSKAEQSDRVGKAAQMLHLDQLLDRLPRALSGGQRQRVAIGRAIVREPGVFLFDEPLSNLDAALRLKMRLEIAKLHADLPGTTMIYVTHDQVEAMTMADRIVVLRDGMIEQVGTPMELYNHPASLFVAQFIGSPKMNVLTGALAAPFGAAHVGIRPEHLELRDGGPWRGRVLHSENLGADSFLYIDLGLEDPLAIRQSGPATAQIGSEIAVAPVDKRLVHRFDDHGLPLAA